MLKTDLAFIQLASVFGRDAVEHARGVKSAHHFARPLLATQQPFQQNGEDFVGVYEAAIFRDCADAVGIAVGRKARVAAFANDRILQHAHVGLNRLWIYVREKRIHFLPDSNEIDAVLAKNMRKHTAPGTIHAIDGELKLRLGNEFQVRKPADRAYVSRLQIHFFDARLLAARH